MFVHEGFYFFFLERPPVVLQRFEGVQFGEEDGRQFWNGGHHLQNAFERHFGRIGREQFERQVNITGDRTVFGNQLLDIVA